MPAASHRPRRSCRWRTGGEVLPQWWMDGLLWGPGRAAPRRLPRGDRTAVEDLAAPDPAGLPAFDRAGEAESADGTGPAVRLGQLQVGRQLREPQLRVLALAWQQPAYCQGLFGLTGEGAKGHGVILAAGARVAGAYVRPRWLGAAVLRTAGDGAGQRGGQRPETSADAAVRSPSTGCQASPGPRASLRSAPAWWARARALARTTSGLEGRPAKPRAIGAHA